jgi:MYXO-CTERM domain-containing protein
MRRLLAFTLGAGLLATPALAATPTEAEIIAEICPACTNIVLAGNATFQASSGRSFIEFSPQVGGTALATFAGLPIGGTTFIDIVGQNDANSNFMFTLNTSTGLGSFNLGGFSPNDIDVTFDFISSATTGSLLITSINDNFQGKIDTIGVRTVPADCPDCTPTPVGVPGPIAGAGLPALFALSGFAFWRRRRATA